MAMVPIGQPYNKYGYSEDPRVPPDYYGDRVYYQGPVEASFEANPRWGTKWGPCVVIMAILFFLLIVIIVVCIIIFFTVGRGGAVAAAATVARPVLGPLSNPRKLRGHNDFITNEMVLDNIIKRKRMCLFDAAYRAPNYKELFESERITTARHFDINAVTEVVNENGVVVKKRDLVHPLKFQEYVRSHGVTDDCHVVVYDHGEADNSITAATYVWWLFKVYGHPKVSMMHGGLREWKARNFDTTSGQAVGVSAGNMTAKWDPIWIVNFNDSFKAWELGSARFLDARSPNDYNGVTKAPDAKKPGHIGGATNIPTNSLLTEHGALKSLQDLKTIFEKELSKTDEHIVYCNTGLQASTLYFALIQADYYAKLFDGSWVEWSWKVE